MAESAMNPKVQGSTWVDRINVALHVRRYLKILARRWLLIVVACTVGLIAGIYAAVNTQNLFQAIAELELARKVQISGTGAPIILEPLDSFYEDQIRALLNRSLAAKIEDKLRKQPKPLLRPPETSILAARGKGSSFQLTVRSSDKEFAREYARVWANEFIEAKRAAARGLIDSKVVGTYEAIATQNKKLEEVRVALDKFRRDHNIGSAKDTADAEQQRLERLKTELTYVQNQRELLQNTPDKDLDSALSTQLRAAGANAKDGKGAGLSSEDALDPLQKFVESSDYSILRSRLNEKESLQAAYARTLKPRHPEMVRLTREIDQIKEQIDKTLALINERRLATIQSLRIKEERLQGMVKDVTQQVIDSRRIQDEFERLRADEVRIQDTLAALNRVVNSIEVSSNEDEAQFSVVGDPIVMPVDPKRALKVVQGFLAGLVAGLGFIYLLHRLDDRLELAEDIEQALDEPVLGQLPQVDVKSIKEGYLLVTKLDRHNMFSEAIRGVRSAIMLGTPNMRKQVLLVSSAVPGDGKTTFTANFACTLGIAGNRVLLIDADLRRGNINSYMQMERGDGLAEVLAGKVHWTQAARQTEIPTLRVITTGALPSNPGELLVGPHTRQFIDEIRTAFDYIVFDCPPLTAIDDTFTLVGLADGLLFVVRAGQTSMRFAKTALGAVRQRGANIFGIVLNGITADNPYYYYNYYYHAYYSKSSARGDGKPRQIPESTAPKRPESTGYLETTIAGGAKALTGQRVSARDLAREAQVKAAFLKARRSGGARPASADAATAAAAGPVASNGAPASAAAPVPVEASAPALSEPPPPA